MTTEKMNAERLADYFVGYIVEEKGDQKHVRRVASWIGFIMSAIANIAESCDRSFKRQLTFEYRSCRFKVKFAHDAGIEEASK